MRASTTFQLHANCSRSKSPGNGLLPFSLLAIFATTQSVISMLEERTKAPADRSPSIMEAPSMFQVARIVGQTLREVIATTADTGQQSESTFDATLIVGGQIADGPPRLFLIYPEGNFIEAGKGTPYFQIGETKYGRPILVTSL